ncbi:dTDP-4-amino-4,6-dideoxygalactose transaminase [Schleiferiaceae bacterium]|nr:dTDP-4-amino-4,6-dideoxygalactose transaminase [Schleiferiaceae bacterium]
MKAIKFTSPCLTGNEMGNIKKLVHLNKFSGDGHYTKLCSNYISKKFDSPRTLLTTSCTHALEMAALLIGVSEGDEVIMPSYTFVSTANAFVLRGAKIIFVDISPDSLNIDINLIEDAITEKTKAIVPVHYAGMCCDMVGLMQIAKKYNLFVIEDAAQAFNSKYNDKFLGTYGDFGCFSFHDTKNIHCGEGGALLINNESYINQAEIIREKGTDRSLFMKGLVDKYTWRSIGSSYLPSELNASFLYAQLELSDEIISYRAKLWDTYDRILSNVKEIFDFETLKVDKLCEHNSHIFLVVLNTKLMRDDLMYHLRENKIQSTFHYIPLHSTPAGFLYSEFVGDDVYTTRMSDQILRLPLHNNLLVSDIEYICETIINYLKNY